VNVQLNVVTAFLAGLVSFVSPCVLPLIPAYLSFLTGSSLEELKAEQDAAQRARVLGHALAFVTGFTVVFMAFGFTAGAIGNVLLQYRDILARVGGIVVVILGLNMIGVFKIPFLMMDKRPQWRSANRSYAHRSSSASDLRPGGRRASDRSSPAFSRWHRNRVTWSQPDCCSCTRPGSPSRFC